MTFSPRRRSQTRQAILAVVSKVQSFSKGDDWWSASSRMGHVIPWLDEHSSGNNPKGEAVNLPQPMDEPRLLELPECMPAAERMSLNGQSTKQVGSPCVVPTSGVLDLPFQHSYAALVAVNGGENGWDRLLWDEPVWQQMMADLTIPANGVPFDIS